MKLFAVIFRTVGEIAKEDGRMSHVVLDQRWQIVEFRTLSNVVAVPLRGYEKGSMSEQFET